MVHYVSRPREKIINVSSGIVTVYDVSGNFVEFAPEKFVLERDDWEIAYISEKDQAEDLVKNGVPRWRIFLLERKGIGRDNRIVWQLFCYDDDRTRLVPDGESL